MNLTWLEDFQTLAATGNFSRAAEQRHMTQPAFSRRIRALEDWLGTTLFDRTSHPAMLTPAGLWFCNVANEMLARTARLPDEARAIADANSTTLRFAATHALSLTFLPKWLRGLESHITLGPIQLVSDVLQQCEALMIQGKVQFLLSHAHAQVPSRLDAATHTSIRVGTEALVPVAVPDKMGAPRYSLANIAKERVPILTYSTESGLGRVLRALRGAQLDDSKVETVFTAHLATVLKTMALEGRGIAWLPWGLIEEDLQNGRLVQAGAANWHVDIDIRLFRRLGTESAAAEAFWQAASGA